MSEFAYTSLLPLLQVLQRADDAQKSLDLLQLLNDGAEIRNMMEGYFDFQQLKVLP